MADKNIDILLNIMLQVENSAALTQLNADLVRTQTAVNNQEAANRKLREGNGLLATTFFNLSERLRNTEIRMDAIFRAGIHLQAMGRDLIGFARDTLGIVGDLTDQWGDFEFMLNRAAGAMGLFSPTLPMYDALKQKIFDVAQELRIFPADDVAKATYYWQSATGQVIDSQEDLETAMAGVTAIMKAAGITQTDYGTAIKGVYSILQQYRLPLSDTGDITAKLMLITQKTALEFGDLIHDKTVNVRFSSTSNCPCDYGSLLLK